MNQDPFELEDSTDDEILNSGPIFPKSKTKNGKKEDAENTLRMKFQEILNVARFELDVDAYRGVFSSFDNDSGKVQHYAACFRRLDLDHPSSVRYAGYTCPSVQAWLDQEILNTSKGTSGKKTKNKQFKHEFACKRGGSDCDCNPFCFKSLGLGGPIQDCLIEQIRSINPTSSDDDEMDINATIDIASQDSISESKMEGPRSKKPRFDSIESVLLHEDSPRYDHQKKESEVDTLQNLKRADNKSSTYELYDCSFTEKSTVDTPQVSIINGSSSSSHQNQSENETSQARNSQITITPRAPQKKAVTSRTKDVQDLPQLRTSNYLNRCDVEQYYRYISLGEHIPHLDMNQLIEQIDSWHNYLLGSHSPSPTVNNVAYCMPPGLTNLGATCYLNSLFQCLAFNVPIMDGILSWTPPLPVACNNQDNEERTKKVQFLSQLQLLLARMTLGPWKSLDTVNFISTLGLSVDEMQDPHEFSKLLFDLIHRSFEETILESSAVSKTLMKLLPTIFGGYSVFTTKCTKCQKSSYQNQEFQDVSLPIIINDTFITASSKKRNSTNTKKVPDLTKTNPTVQDCLDRYLEYETVSDYFCETCKAQQDVERCMLFKVLPPVLNVHLLRYGYDLKTSTRKKLMDKIILSKTIDVPIYASVKGKWTLTEKKSYNLCAVQEHKGASAHGGHYIAEVMDWLTGTWMKCNDNDVEILRSGSSYTFDSNNYQTNVEGSSDAYSLFYVQQTYLASQASETIKRILGGCYNQNCFGIVQQVNHERLECQRLESEIQMRTKMLNDRLAQRKQWLMKLFLPQLDEDAKNHKEDDILYWVHSDILRRFISCEDGLEDVLSSCCLISNKEFLCDHGLGLHPRTARYGKMITKRSYDNFIQQLKNERLDTLPFQSKDDSIDRMDFKNIDLEITNKSNLFCQECVDSFRSDLRTRIEGFDAAYKLLQDFDGDSDIDTTTHDILDDGVRYVVSKQFVSSFQRIMKQKMKEVVNHGHKGIDLLDMDSSVISFTNEAIDLKVNSSITCPFGNCHFAFNKKLVRHVSVNTWSSLVRLFPTAIKHSVHIKVSIENQGLEICDSCVRDQERKMDLSSNILSWASRVASDDILSILLSKSANPLVETDAFKLKSKLRYYIVHKDDLDEWRSVVNHICGTFSSLKGKDAVKGKKIKSHVERRLFKPHVDQISEEKKNEHLLCDFKFKSILCREHRKILCHLSPIDEINSYKHCGRFTTDEYGGSTINYNKVELLNQEVYQAYLTSLKELAEALVLSVLGEKTTSDGPMECLSNYHPQITVHNDSITFVKKQYRDGTESDILSMVACGCNVSFEPPLCMSRCCWDAWGKEMDVNLSEESIETKEHHNINEEVNEISPLSSSISFQVFEISEEIDLDSYCESIANERNPPEVDSSVSRNARRSNRNRRKCTFAVSAEKDANVAKLKLLVSERTKIEHISDISFYLYIDSLLKLDDRVNAKSLLHILGDASLEHDPILLLQIQSNNRQLKKIDRQEKDEVIVAQLMSVVGESKSETVPSKERGFQGTMLHWSPNNRKKSLGNGNVVEVID